MIGGFYDPTPTTVLLDARRHIHALALLYDFLYIVLYTIRDNDELNGSTLFTLLYFMVVISRRKSGLRMRIYFRSRAYSNP